MRSLRPLLGPILMVTVLPATSVQAQAVSNLRITADDDLGTATEQVRYFNVAGCLCERPVTLEMTVSSLGVDGALKIVSGTDCIDGDGDIEADCATLYSTRLEDSASVLTLETTVQAMLGGCEAIEGTRSVFAVVDRDTTDDGYEVLASADYQVDTAAPDAPEASTVVAGEGLAEVVFSDDTSAEVGSSYQVLCTVDGKPAFESPPEAAFVSAFDVCGETVEATALEVCADETKSTDSVTVLGLEDGTEYTFSVVAVDAAGNPSAVVEVGSATPSPEEDFFERYRREGGAADGGHCFVATAAYGDYGHPQVRVLRAFRDRILSRTALGRFAIDAYYTVSPPIAAWIAKKDILRDVTRRGLAPFVDAAALLLAGEGEGDR